MTITLQAVNELIAPLESAGEPSIREQKFLNLAKAFKQLAADNVALKKSAPAPFSKLMMEALDTYHSKADDVPELAMLSAYVKLRDGLKTPATDRIVAGIKADAITASLDACSDYLETDCVMDRLDISYEDAEKRTSGAIEFHDAMVNFANQVREGAK